MIGILRQASMVLLVLAVPVRAQFAGLAATDDGKQLLFTSQMLLKGAKASTPWPENRLYQFGSGRVELVVERGSLAPHSSHASDDGVAHPSISGDGRVIGFTFNGVCRTPMDCLEVVNRVEVRGLETLNLGPGFVQIGRDGLWALVTNQVYDYSQPQSRGISTTSNLLELSTGQRTTPPGPALSLDGHLSLFTLASDGAVLTVQFDLTAPIGVEGVVAPAYGIWKRGQFTQIPLPPGDPMGPFALSSDAGTIVSYSYSPAVRKSRIVVTSMKQGKSTTVVEGDPGQRLIFMAVSNNGQQVLYRVALSGNVNGPCFVWDAATGITTEVPMQAGELATDGTLSGGGTVAFVATSHFRIVKFEIPSKIASPLFSQTPFCEDPVPLAGGSLARLHCVFPGPPASLEGKVAYDGYAMPLLYSAPGEIAVQIPWEWDNFFPPTLSLKVSGDSPFEASQPLQVFDGAPRILPSDSGQPSLFGIKIIKGDWSGLLTSQPAPGDVFYIYMTGLGWTANRETTGVPASSTLPNPIQWKLACQFLPRSPFAELLFAGLAPGTIGVYQTAFRMPQGGSTVPATGIRCLLESPAMSVSFGPDLPVYGVSGHGGFTSASGMER